MLSLNFDIFLKVFKKVDHALYGGFRLGMVGFQ